MTAKDWTSEAILDLARGYQSACVVAAAAFGLVVGGSATAADLPSVITIAGPSQAASGYVIATGYGVVISYNFV